MKQCTTCNEHKELSEFHKNKCRGDGQAAQACAAYTEGDSMTARAIVVSAYVAAALVLGGCGIPTCVRYRKAMDKANMELIRDWQNRDSLEVER